MDHVVPVSHNGPKSWTNVVTACRNCNQKKANRTPEKANMPLLKEPRMPNWLPNQEIQFSAGQVPPTWLQYLRFNAG